MSVRVRIGPSPTGDPHVGTAYIALFNYVFARQNQGTFVLRVEDTDRARSDPAWEEMLVDALRWLGLTWDEGPDVGGPHAPYRQSERGAIYQEHVQMLLDNGRAYRCFCTPERLKQLRQEQMARKENPGYDGRCRGLTPEEVARQLEAGTAHVVRMRVPDEGITTFHDRLRGPVEIKNSQIDDQVLLKSDGMPTYHLASVVDDHMMEITHVMRAEEWITSTPKHVLLYQAFGWEPPEFVHMPLLRNQDKSKISKRKNPVSLNYFRDAGFYPEALLNYLGMMGFTLPDGREKFTLLDLKEHFSFNRLTLGGPVFDLQKLTWLNGLYVRESSEADLLQQIREQVLSDARLKQIVPLIQPRIDKLEDFVDATAYFFSGDVAYDAHATKNLVPKKRTRKEMIAALQAVVEAVDKMPAFTTESVESMLRQACEDLGYKPKDLFMPVRVAVTGRTATPGLFETLQVLGKERCRRRLRGAIAHLKLQKDPVEG